MGASRGNQNSSKLKTLPDEVFLAYYRLLHAGAIKVQQTARELGVNRNTVERWFFNQENLDLRKEEGVRSRWLRRNQPAQLKRQKDREKAIRLKAELDQITRLR